MQSLIEYSKRKIYGKLKDVKNLKKSANTLFCSAIVSIKINSKFDSMKLKLSFLALPLLALSFLPAKVASQVNPVEQLDGTKWCTFSKTNSIARVTYRGDLSYFSSGNTCMRLDKVGEIGVWKVAFEWWSQESKIRVAEYALGSWISPKVFAYKEAKSAEDRRSPYASTTPGTRGAGYINFVDSKTLRMSQMGRGANGDVTILVYYLERVDAFPDLTIPLTFPLPKNNQ